MSSWFAQATDIVLSQSPDIPDASTPVSQSETFPFSCSLSTETTPPCIQKIFANCFSRSKSSPKPLAKLQLATSKERILLFGSSPSSQLSATIRTTTSSPWNLFSQHHTKTPLRTLSAKGLFSPQTPPKENSEKSFSQSLQFSETIPQSLDHNESSSTPLSHERPSFFIEDTPLPSPKTESLLKAQLISPKKEDAVAQEQKNTWFHSPSSPSQTFSESPDSSDHPSKEDPHSQQKSHRIQKRKARAITVVPVITPPTVGIFSLSYLLTKQGILSDFSAYSAHKENLEITQKELTMLHQQRIEQMQKIVDKSKTTRFWDSLASLVAAIVPWAEMGVAVTIIAMGGGILSWFSLFAALIMIVISLIEVFDGWRAIAKHLPGKDLERKIRYLGYVKLALTLFSCVLSASSLYVAKLGMSPLLEGVVKSISPALSGMLGLTQGIALSLQSSSQKIRARCAQIDAQIELVNWERDEYFLRTEQLLDSMQTSFEQLSETLQLQKEIGQTFVEALR